LQAAMVAAKDSLLPKKVQDFSDLWSSRVTRTTSHELGHCFGMDHCIYYACVMQGTAGLLEDCRQPPYLCPVCLAKLSYTVAGETAKVGTGGAESSYMEERYRALEAFCAARTSTGMYAGFHAWLVARREASTSFTE
jgi:archaemetzincin